VFAVNVVYKTATSAVQLANCILLHVIAYSHNSCGSHAAWGQTKTS